MRYPVVVHQAQFSMYRSDYPRCQVKSAERRWLVMHEPTGTYIEARTRREGLWLLKHAAKRH